MSRAMRASSADVGSSAGKLVRVSAQGCRGFGQLHALAQRFGFVRRGHACQAAHHPQCFDQLRADAAQRMQAGKRILRHPAEHTPAQRRVFARTQRYGAIVVTHAALRLQARRQQTEQR